ncbi:MAG TPA: SulP family inorganic anion transporter [Solirubrobacter sp.]|nr:SulP family inorganic anion transporter [Solirubrobacter sp.]
MFLSLRRYRGAWLRGDLIAGLTVWAVLVPESLAYASIAGVSPVVGLYAAPGALILYAAFGSSRHLITGPMSASAALSAATVADLVPTGSDTFVTMTAALAVTTGLAALIAGLIRLGFLASFISEPVMKGFIIGLALTIIVGQLPSLFGISKGSGDFFEKAWDLISHLGDTQGTTLLVGACSLAVVLVLRRVAPVVPGSLVAVLLGIAAVELFDLDRHGVAIVGHIDGGLPAFGVPDVKLSQFGQLVSGGVAIMLVAFAEGLGAAKTYASRNHYEISVNRELIGLGAANVAAGLSSGMVVNGSLSKTAVNGTAGARTQLSGLIVAALTLVTLLLLTGLFESLPEATLAAVVVAAVIELVDIGALVTLHGYTTGRIRTGFDVAARPDFIAAIAAMAGVLVFDTLPGLFIGISVSLLLLIYRASRPYVATLGREPGTDRFADTARDPALETVDGVSVLRVEGGLYFANADAVRRQIEAAAATARAVVLDAASVPFVDATAARMLIQVSSDLSRRGRRFFMAAEIGAVREVLSEVTEGETWTVFPTVEDAVDAATAPPA